jgi:hypothetical protein
MRKISVGDQVAFTRDYLASLTDAGRKFRCAQARGTVMRFVNLTLTGPGILAVVRWHTEGGKHSVVNAGNLCLANSTAFIEETRRRAWPG